MAIVCQRRNLMTYDKEHHQSGAWKTARKQALKLLQHDCTMCGKKDLIGDDLTVDHIIAVKNGGTNEIDNLTILCRSCNSSKGTRTYKRVTYINERWV